MAPRTRYTKSGDVNVAYQVIGDGPFDLVFAPGFVSHLEAAWEIPFMAGFWAKLYVFWAAAEAGLYGVVLIGAVLTVVALFYYLVVAKRMYIDAPEVRTPVPVPPALGVVLAVSALAVVLLGLYPGPLVDAALRAAAPLF